MAIWRDQQILSAGSRYNPEYAVPPCRVVILPGPGQAVKTIAYGCTQWFISFGAIDDVK